MPFKPRFYLKACFILLFALHFFAFDVDQCNADDPPNVIVVMADDLGIGDISPTNPECKIRTPNLETMANEGLTFLDAHTPSSVCTPTRYGLLTGRYNWRSRLARGVLSGTSEHLIPADRPTLGHLMRKADYHTAMIGKWHLGWDWHKTDGKINFTQPVKNGPDINGFDQYYGHCGSLDMPPYVWVDTGRITAQPDREEGVTSKEDPYGWYRKGPIGSDFKIEEVLPHLFDKSISHVKTRAKTGKPFFLYLALPAPHTPIVPVPPFKGSSGMNPYADFVIQTDHHMGELFEALREADIDDNTLVIFTSDNGCSPQANFEVLEKHGHDPSGKYRGHKADIYEGGHRVPFIARWPGHIKAGRTTDALTCLTDIYPTLESISGQSPQPLGGEDGFSLLPVFEGAVASKRETLISHSIGGSFAIRQGPWKLCLSAGSGGWSAPREVEAKKKGLPPIQLFNLDEDPAEQKNLAEINPDKVQTLLRLLDQQVRNGRCTPGKAVANDRDVEFLPKGVEILKANSKDIESTSDESAETTEDRSQNQSEDTSPANDVDLSHWKLTLPTNESGAYEGHPAEISPKQLKDGFKDSHFQIDKDGSLVFWCPVNGARTEGTDYPRSELREMLSPNDPSVNWGASGTHILAARCRVLEVPGNPKVVIGQIHSYSGKARPLIKLQYFNGRIEALIKLSPTKAKDKKLTFDQVGLNKDIAWEIKLKDGVLNITVNSKSQSVNIVQADADWAKQTFYFKAGVYPMDNEGAATEGARVSFSELMVAHTE